MAKKKTRAVVKLHLAAGKATPAYPVGPSLGGHGINLMGFVTEFNSRTNHLSGLKIPVAVTVYEDRSFSVEIKSPTTASLLRQAAGLAKGSATPNGKPVASITRDQLRAIAQQKLADTNAHDLAQVEKMVLGTARSMGIAVQE